MRPLTVTAHLLQGYVAADPWSPALDGILAYWALREQLGEEEFALGMTGQRALTEAELPLAVETDADDRWWYQCSAPVALGEAQQFARHVHRRFDDQHERYLRDGVKRVETAAGPYKNYRNRSLVRLARAVRWHAVGDAAAIERLLRRCAFVGAGSTHGWGEVARWEVTPDAGGERMARFWRPLPSGFAAAHGVEGLEMRWGIRPPGRAPEHQALCVMP